jgi:hypothetical protein
MHESTNPRNSRISASTELARDVFAWQEQIHTDRETIPNAKPISAFDFRLAYAITQYTNKHSRKAWPKQETLAADLGVDVRTVGRGIANLVKRGHLNVTRRGREQSAIYRMILQDKTSVSGHDEVRQDTDVRSKPQDKTSVSSRQDICVLKTGHRCLIEPLLEPLREEDSPQLDLADEVGLRRRSPSSGTEADTDFEEFYRHYPKRVAKAAALKAYCAVISKRLATPAQLLNGALRYAAERSNQDPKYTKHASTWLTGGCWDDEPAQPIGATYNSSPPGQSHHIAVAEQIARQLMEDGGHVQ